MLPLLAIKTYHRTDAHKTRGALRITIKQGFSLNLTILSAWICVGNINKSHQI